MANTKKKTTKKRDVKPDGVYVSLESSKEKLISFKVNEFDDKAEINTALNGLLRIVSGVLISSSLHFMSHEEMEPSIEKLKTIFSKISSRFFDSVSEYMNESIDKVFGEKFDNKDKEEVESKQSTDSDITGKA
jgi:hypothetical protein